MNAPRPRLAYVVNSLDPGGTEKLVVEMSLAFADEYEVSVVCLDRPGTWAGELRARGIPVQCLWRQPGLDPAMPLQLARYFRDKGVRIVHAHQCTAWFYGALSRLLHPVPRLLFEEHGRFFPEVENRKRALVNRWLVRKLTHNCVAVSEDIRERLQRYEGLDADEIQVIYNGVKPEPALTPDECAAARNQFGIGPDNFLVGTVGRFDPIKNLPLLVDSLALAGREQPGLRGLLVGDGPVAGEIRAHIAVSGQGERVVLPGFRDDARRLVQCMDLFVLSSFSEGTSMALLEAMAAGVPVAVTAVGGNPEIVLDGETGWIVPSDSVEKLTAAILDAARDGVKRGRMGTAGRERFKARFAFDRMIEAYRRCYRELTAGGHP
jgi:glycosyltransferase involved in cell wall biosynthesis